MRPADPEVQRHLEEFAHDIEGAGEEHIAPAALRAVASALGLVDPDLGAMLARAVELRRLGEAWALVTAQAPDAAASALPASPAEVV